MKTSIQASTGIDGLDTILSGLRNGDNVVWQVDDIEDYAYFVHGFVRRAAREQKKIIYVRFAQHRELVKPAEGATVHALDASGGFEPFSAQVHSIITQEGEGVYYVFDCLSDLLSVWGTDLMIGNFFMISCPYLFQLKTIAYFGLVRSSHAFKTVARIRETTQVLLDIYNTGTDLYVHPLKVKGRYADTMFLPHKKEGEHFVPVTCSVDMTRLGNYMSGRESGQSKRNLDHWDRLFLDAEDLLQKEGAIAEKEQALAHLCRMMIGREKRVLDLARQNFTLQDVIAVKKRLIGTGHIGGKSAGMLLARKILLNDTAGDWASFIEPHDSFFVGSDVFYTYIVENGWWKLLMRQKSSEGYFEAARVLKELMLGGFFPDEIEEQFRQVIDYFGQAPIIIRSSSLLEDAFGNAFAGKYDSIFSINQGTPEQRYSTFREYVRRVFASTMNEDALIYRKQRGLDKMDEQMALLVQRVSGSYRKRYFFPDLGGVGISHNTFAWSRDMDPRAGMLRLVLGLGTRAVNRVEHDYPRIVALDAPLQKPHAGLGDTKKYSQHYVDVLDIEKNSFETIPLASAMVKGMNIKRELVGVRDTAADRHFDKHADGPGEAWILTFDAFFSDSAFVDLMRRMLKKLESIYKNPVDIEFTVNFVNDSAFLVNLVQCRPLQTKGKRAQGGIPTGIPDADILFQADGSFMGGGSLQPIDRIIYIDPEGYSSLSLSGKYDIARLIGKLNRRIQDKDKTPTMLMGPGRWGTTTPSLGVPVRFAEINNISVLVEIEYMGEKKLMPELSFGTHFFQDLVETDTFYVALFTGSKHTVFNRKLIDALDNELAAVVPESEHYAEIVKVCNTEEQSLYLMADLVAQKVLCGKSSPSDR